MGRNGGLARLLALAHAIGWRFVRESAGGGHLLLHHDGTEDVPSTGLWMTLPKRVAESPGARTLPNLARDLLRNAGLVPQTGGEPVPGLRRAPKRPTGEAREREQTRAVRGAEARRLRVVSAIERRESELRGFRRLMFPD